jgi:hypothetical protein
LPFSEAIATFGPGGVPKRYVEEPGGGIASENGERRVRSRRIMG